MEKIRRLAIIPARGNSKRIKKKNIKFFFKKPIIFYSIKNVINSKLFSKIHVSSENNSILKIANNHGIKTDFKRPKYLSKDSTKIFEVLNFVLKKYIKMNQYFDEVWLIYPCAPLTKHQDLIKASKYFNNTNKKYPLVSLKEFEVPIEWALKEKQNIFVPIKKKNLLLNSQNIIKSYHESASFAIFAKNLILKNKSTSDKYYGYILPKNRAVDIDDVEDWKLAESLFVKK